MPTLPPPDCGFMMRNSRVGGCAGRCCGARSRAWVVSARRPVHIPRPTGRGRPGQPTARRPLRSARGRQQAAPRRTRWRASWAGHGGRAPTPTPPRFRRAPPTDAEQHGALDTGARDNEHADGRPRHERQARCPCPHGPSVSHKAHHTCLNHDRASPASGDTARGERCDDAKKEVRSWPRRTTLPSLRPNVRRVA